MADPIQDLIEYLFGSDAKQQDYQKPRTITAPNDPDLIAYLNRAGVDYYNAGNGLISFSVQWPTTKQPVDPNDPPGTTYSTSGGGSGYSVTSQYQHMASMYGISVSSSQIQALIQGQVSPDEFHQRLVVIERLKRNKEFLDQFEQEVKAMKLGKFDFKDRVDFILGKKPAQFYNLWNQTEARTALADRGFDIGKGQGDWDVDRKEVQNILGDLGLTGPEGAGVTAQALKQVADVYAQVTGQLPAARWLEYGISDRERRMIATGRASQGTLNKFNRLLGTLEKISQGTVHQGFAPERGSQTGGY